MCGRVLNGIMSDVSPGAVEIEWESYPDGKRESDISPSSSAQAGRSGGARHVHLPQRESLPSCRSRSRSGRLYLTAYNVLDGFEGEKDADNHRNTVGGWRVGRPALDQSQSLRAS